MAYTGNDGKVTVDTIDYPTTSWELNESIDPIDTTHMDDTSVPTSRSFISNGLRNATGSFVFDITAAKRPPRATVGAPVAFTLQEAEKAFAGNCLITSVGIPVAVGEKIVCTCEIQVSGDVTITP